MFQSGICFIVDIMFYGIRMNNNIDKWFNELMLESKATLLASMSKLLGKEDAEDVLQDAYFKVYEAKKSGLHHENYKAFLFKIARNNALSRLRHNKIINSSLKAVHDVDIERLAQITNEDKIRKDQDSTLLFNAINELPPICRQVFVLRKFKQISHSEIASMLQISNKTVENHITKAVKHCRDSILLHYKNKSTKAQIKQTGT